MPYDLRVKAAVGPTRAEVYATSSDEAEEWVESSDDTSNNTSRQASMSKQRRASRSSSSAVSLQGDSEGSESVVAVPPQLQRTQFSSLGELQEYLVDYEKATYQSYRVRTNNKVSERNNKIRTSNSSAALVPDEWVFYAKTFVCTHAGKYKPRGEGKRKRQQSRLLGCEAQINACVQVVDDSVPTFAVRITTARLEHNHHLSKHTFLQYPRNRMAIKSDLIETVDELRRAGAKKKSIMRYIQEKSGCVPNNQDVHNLVRKLKKQSDTAPTSAKRLRQWMIEFSAEPGNIGRIFVDKVQKKTVATCITSQTEHMRELFDRFPEVLMIDATHGTNVSKYKVNATHGTNVSKYEVLMIDATHGTNVSKYKVFSIMAHDVFGKGQFVQHAVLQNERRPMLMKALGEFKRNNPAWTRIKCILIDKDFTEISVLKLMFPDAILLLCQFHVIKYLREEITRADYGFNAWQKQQLQSIASLLVYAKTLLTLWVLYAMNWSLDVLSWALDMVSWALDVLSWALEVLSWVQNVLSWALDMVSWALDVLSWALEVLSWVQNVLS
ncbi:hypothetical protein PR003_g26031 [Phytophthora rubi]|uniref:ZSWIM1/3 RNaseH-like domain-containing protein n=1 Tax=Phytophthora rubi TaxID=129364 RepID=A0A6A4C9L1_9STRA|nr:hypothetical protein PR003_g26031 [Phytophthora rubi]